MAGRGKVAVKGYRQHLEAMGVSKGQGCLLVKCSGCTAVRKFPTSDVGKPWDHFANKLRWAGWSTKGGRNRCPTCQGFAKKPANIWSADDAAQVARSVGEWSGKTGETEMKTDVKTPAVPAQAAATARSLSVREMKLLTLKLEEVFDEEAGRYEPGWGDRKVAEALDLPWKLVADFREEAYGALRSSPELEAALEAVAGVERKIVALDAEVASRLAGMRQELEQALRKVEGAGP